MYSAGSPNRPARRGWAKRSLQCRALHAILERNGRPCQRWLLPKYRGHWPHDCEAKTDAHAVFRAPGHSRGSQPYHLSSSLPLHNNIPARHQPVFIVSYKSVQMEMHPFMAQEKLLAYCNNNRIAVAALAPLASISRFAKCLCYITSLHVHAHVYLCTLFLNSITLIPTQSSSGFFSF